MGHLPRPQRVFTGFQKVSFGPLEDRWDIETSWCGNSGGWSFLSYDG